MFGNETTILGKRVGKKSSGNEKVAEMTTKKSLSSCLSEGSTSFIDIIMQ